MSSYADLQAVHVVVPAHDEQERVGACLESVVRAAAALREAHPHLTVGTTLVLDRCTDGSEAEARVLGVHTLAVDAGCVGGARRAGVRHSSDLLRARGVPPAAVLVVNTDADCVVPQTWLLDHVALATDHDLVQGEVLPDPAELSPAVLAAWLVRNPPGRGSLHGANLGFRLDAYLAAGGFPEVSEHEDRLLVRAMKALGAASISGTTVITSSRRTGRTPGGFAAYLTRLQEELAAQR